MKQPKTPKTRTLLVTADKTFKITVPASAKITFGPWTPQKRAVAESYQTNNERGGTLRIYDGKNVIAVFAHVTAYRDLALDYSELVAKEEGASIWKSDQSGYEREDKVQRKDEWVSAKRIGNGA